LKAIPCRFYLQNGRGGAGQLCAYSHVFDPGEAAAATVAAAAARLPVSGASLDVPALGDRNTSAKRAGVPCT